jgi:cytidylate kinase
MTNSNKKFAKIIAIDGPSGSGKSTLAQIVAAKLSFLYIDTGAMFRALGIVLNEKFGPFESEEYNKPSSHKIQLFLASLNVEYGRNNSLISINGVDYTAQIRDHAVSKLASVVSAWDEVRNFLKFFQRSLVDDRPCVMEGRDIGTVVFPDAYCKIFLTANPLVRAQRRLDQLKELKPQNHYSLEEILRDVEARDESDRNRPIAPLKKAEDAFELDSSHLSKDQVIDKIIEVSKYRIQQLGINHEFTNLRSK